MTLLPNLPPRSTDPDPDVIVKVCVPALVASTSPEIETGPLFPVAAVSIVVLPTSFNFPVIFT